MSFVRGKVKLLYCFISKTSLYRKGYASSKNSIDPWIISLKVVLGGFSNMPANQLV